MPNRKRSSDDNRRRTEQAMGSCNNAGVCKEEFRLIKKFLRATLSRRFKIAGAVYLIIDEPRLEN